MSVKSVTPEVSAHGATEWHVPPDGAGRIRSRYELPLNGDEAVPLVLLPPTFGQSMADYGAMSWVLRQNGFRVLRFDYRNHVGRSDGDMLDFTASSAIRDLHTMGDVAQSTAHGQPVAVLTFSLAFRLALRAYRRRPDVDLILGIAGVVDVRKTLAEALGEDHFAQLERGMLAASGNALGYEIRDTFVKDLAAEGLTSLRSSTRDAHGYQNALVMILNERDPWVSAGDVRVALEDRAAPTEILVMPDVAQHHLQRNPAAARTILTETVRACRRHLGLPGDQAVVEPPSVPEMLRIRRAELARERERAIPA